MLGFVWRWVVQEEEQTDREDVIIPELGLVLQGGGGRGGACWGNEPRGVLVHDV